MLVKEIEREKERKRGKKKRREEGGTGGREEDAFLKSLKIRMQSYVEYRGFSY